MAVPDEALDALATSAIFPVIAVALLGVVQETEGLALAVVAVISAKMVEMKPTIKAL